MHAEGTGHQDHLLQGLGLRSMDDLRRRCDRKHGKRRAACPLFWTLGGQQVGKAAISGWRDVLVPALRARSPDLAIWPFSGPLFDLFRPARVVVAETYPAEFYGHLDVDFAPGRPGRGSGKRVQRDRAGNASALLCWAHTAGVELSTELRTQVADGFGPAADGEDRFDAAVGLLGMLNVVLRGRPPGDPREEAVQRVEGWILGQAAGE